MANEVLTHERCIFFDPNTQECKRLDILSGSPIMTEMREKLRTGKIGSHLFWRIDSEINRQPSQALPLFDDTDQQELICIASAPRLLTNGYPDVSQQLTCDRYWDVSGIPGPESRVPPSVEEHIGSLLPSPRP